MRKCDGCGKLKFKPAPMLCDEVWLKLANARELLCDRCMWRRQRERHVSITISSLKPVPVNLASGWFDDFARLVNSPPENIDEWRRFALDPWVLARNFPPHPWLVNPHAIEVLKNEIFMQQFGSVHELAAFLSDFLQNGAKALPARAKVKLTLVKSDEPEPAA